MNQFLIIAYPHEIGGWVSILPDFVGVTGRGNEMGLAMWRATTAAQQIYEVLGQLDQRLPEPTDLAAARTRHLWINAHGLDWSTAVVRSVRLSDTPQSWARNRAALQVSASAALPGKQRSKSNGHIPNSRVQVDLR